MASKFQITGDALWQRMNLAVDKVQDRLYRTTRAIETAGISYAIVGGNAVRAWVAQADEAAVRTTRDVDILINRSDFPAVCQAMEKAGFVFRHVNHVDMFLDGADAKARDSVHLVFAGEKVRPEHPTAAPTTNEAIEMPLHRTIALEALVRMKLNSFRDKDKMHLRDLIDVGLVTAKTQEALPAPLAQRLQYLFDNPED